MDCFSSAWGTSSSSLNEDAQRALRLLGLTLTRRSKGEDAVPMAGIPVRNAESYIQRLVAIGEKVVVCDQVEDPATATGIVERDVTRIVTPGTITEEDSLDARANNYLAAIDGESVAYVDVSTGDFAVRPLGDDDIVEVLNALEAAECLLPGVGADRGGLRRRPRPCGRLRPDRASRLGLRSRLGAAQPEAAVQSAQSRGLRHRRGRDPAGCRRRRARLPRGDAAGGRRAGAAHPPRSP